jgi:hypothetical protein
MRNPIYPVLVILPVLAFTLFPGCSSDNSTAPVDNHVTETKTISTAIDILWVIDNSGSMGTNQAKVASAFGSFSALLLEKGYHFRMAVTTTDAYLKTGGRDKYRENCGQAILDESTPDLATKFSTNIQQGTSGSGNERAFDSIKTAFESSLNATYNFPVQGTFLGIIIIGDEDDSSVGSGTTLIPVSTYTSYLMERFDCRVYSITRLPGTGTGEGVRICQLVDDFSGIKGDITASDFSSTMSSFSASMARHNTSVALSGVPDAPSISVTVDSVSVPEDPANGWSYDDSSRTIYFNGMSHPAEGAVINVRYIPAP